MLRCIALELRKNCYWPFVLLPVVGIVCLGFCNTVYDFSGTQITLFELVRQIRLGKITPDIAFSAPVMWQQAFQSWLALFAPLLVSFGYVVTLSSERQNGQMRFELIRAGNIRYCVSKIASGALFCGLVFFVGYILFGLLLKIFLPSFFAFGAEDQSFYMEFYFGNSMPGFLCRQLVGGFLFGVFAGVFGIGVAVFFDDKYMLICLPFLLNYIYQQVFRKIAQERYANGAETAAWAEAFYPASIANISTSRYWVIPMMVLVVIYLVVIIAFCIIVKRGKKW